MFTITIESNGGLEQMAREWPTCDVFKSGSEQFQRIMREELDILMESFSEVDSKEMVKMYKAVIRSECGNFKHYITHGQSAYISNSSGKTVLTVK